MRGAWEFIIRNDERNPLTNVPRALDVTFNKLNKLWKGLERVFKVSSFQKKTRRFCRGFEKLGDFCFPPPQPDTAQSPVATAPGQRTMWTTSYGRVFVYTYVYIYIQDICKYTYVPTNLRTWIMKLLSIPLSNNLWRCWNHVYHVYSIKRIKEPDGVCSVLVRWLFLACVSCAKEMARSVAFVQPGTFQVQWHFLCPTCLRLVLWSCFPKANDSRTYQAMALFVFGFKNIQSILNFPAKMRNICGCGCIGSNNWKMSMTIWLYYGNVSDTYSSVSKQKHLSAMPLKDKTYWQACVSPDPFLCFEKENHENLWTSLNFTEWLSSKLHCMTACPTWNLSDLQDDVPTFNRDLPPLLSLTNFENLLYFLWFEQIQGLGETIRAGEDFTHTSIPEWNWIWIRTTLQIAVGQCDQKLLTQHDSLWQLGEWKIRRNSSFQRCEKWNFIVLWTLHVSARWTNSSGWLPRKGSYTLHLVPSIQVRMHSSTFHAIREQNMCEVMSMCSFVIFLGFTI